MKKMIVLNHKMSLTKEETQEYILNIKERIPSDKEVIICPSNIFLPYYEGKYDFKLGVQNMCYGKTGSITGEVSGYQLKSFGVEYAIIGHSERVIYFKEDKELINEKIKAALSYNIKPIVCVGENKEEKALKKTGVVLTNQIKKYFKDIEVTNDITIAYEPIWAIGGTKSASIKDIKETILMIKELVSKLYKIDIRVLYGGSVNADNIDDIISLDCVDGVLIGAKSSDYKNMIEVFKH